MKLPVLLASIALAWCALGAIVLGPGVLVYPLAWAAVAATIFAVHKLSHFRGSPQPIAYRSSTAARPAEFPRDDSAAVVR